MPDPFISAQDLTDYLGRDVTSDDGATIVLDAACQICRDIAQQPFNAGTATVSLDGTGTDALLLPYQPVLNAGTVTVDGVAETNFMLTANGMLLRGSAGMNPRLCWPRGRQNVGVTFEYGYADGDVPTSVRMVALGLASRLIVQGVAQSETIGDTTIAYGMAASDLTANEQRILYLARRNRSF